MFSKLLTSSALVLALSLQAQAHAAVAPALGVSGTPVRNDVKRPSTAQPCGAGANIASEIDSSTAVTAAADGTFDTTAIDFNAGTDGSRQFTAKVDATGTGKSFVAATITTNGDGNPTSVGSQPLVAKLPAGTKCTGGATGNKCLVQFVSTAGFGNCLVVAQGASGAASAAAPTASAATAGNAAANAAAAGTGAAAANAASNAAAAKGTTTKKAGAKKVKKAKKANAAVKKQRDLTLFEDQAPDFADVSSADAASATDSTAASTATDVADATSTDTAAAASSTDSAAATASTAAAGAKKTKKGKKAKKTKKAKKAAAAAAASSSAAAAAATDSAAIAATDSAAAATVTDSAAAATATVDSTFTNAADAPSTEDPAATEDVSARAEEPMRKRAGTTAARALMYDLEDRDEDVVVVRRGAFNWIWA
ncbi:hypothetical protein CPB84DRAFT_1773746 [Gymnopilus junonius]|uniref:Uncharacterized protein n=1 Tax=Gymnopilus junonius TaxID=109634 RepID=A0A9P5NTI0_GYMJU|nr:hypothetical protein CPB84DRAFT_1773746 [Gymnopilus junonius]